MTDLTAAVPPPHGEGASARVLRIEKSARWATLNLRELWAYRELLFFLTWRDVRTSYNQTALGIAWAVLKPLLATALFTFVFGSIAKLSGEYKVPYPLFVFTGLLPWTYFASCLALSSDSVVGNASLVTKVYFPRLLIPLAAIVSPIIDFVITFVFLVFMLAYYGQAPYWHAIALPFFLMLAFLAAFGMGLWLSALNVRYRDVRYIVPFLTQLWFFATPVVYGFSNVPAKWRWLIELNPMTGAVVGFRWAVLGRGLPDYRLYAISLAVGLCLSAAGLLYFKHVERQFADVI